MTTGSRALANKVAFISGGASGIGRAIVTRFLAEGALVCFGDVDLERGSALAAETGAEFVKLDVASEEDWALAMDRIAARHDRLDVLVNNAGIIGAGASLEDIERASWDRLFAVNVTGVMLGCKYVSPLMQRNKAIPAGSIINMSSNAGLLGAPDIAYTATKGAVRMMSKSIAVGFARRGWAIRCNSIHPGPIDTPIFDPLRALPPAQSELMFSSILGMVPMGRLGRPEEIAAMAVFLASDESSYSTGAEFVADGGSTAALPVRKGHTWKAAPPG